MQPWRRLWKLFNSSFKPHFQILSLLNLIPSIFLLKTQGSISVWPLKIPKTPRILFSNMDSDLTWPMKSFPRKNWQIYSNSVIVMESKSFSLD